MAVVVDAQTGLDPHTLRLMEVAAARGLDRLLVVHEIDAAGVKPAAVLTQLQAAFVERNLEDGDVDPRELHAPLEQAVREGHLIPVAFASARSGAGVGELLGMIVQLLPDATDCNPPQLLQTVNGTAVPLAAMPDPAAHVLAPPPFPHPCTTWRSSPSAAARSPAP